MAYAHWRAGRAQQPAVFELFFRENPFGGGFTLLAGLHDCLRFLRGFRFSEDDVEFLRSVMPPTTDPAFFQFLLQLDASRVTLRSVPEGSVVFARVPLMEVEGPLAVVQLVETSLLCLVNYARGVPELLRMWEPGLQQRRSLPHAAGPKRKLLEMGLRRAQGPDGGLTASRYTYIGGERLLWRHAATSNTHAHTHTHTHPHPHTTRARVRADGGTWPSGFDLTSNVQAGFLFGIPVTGTMAHSYVTSFTSLEEVWPQTLAAANGDPEPVDLISLTKGLLTRVCELLGAEAGRVHEGELAAFLSYAAAYPHNFLSVIDSYSVGCSGLLNFCAVALALCELGYRPVGVRLDSGDLCSLSVDVRRVFRRCSQQLQLALIASPTSFSAPAFDSLIIVGTNNISEKSLTEINLRENEIDVVGVGTHLVTCTRQPSLGCVYKVKPGDTQTVFCSGGCPSCPSGACVVQLVEVRGRPRMKISEDPEKSTLPGRKQVFRLMDADGGPFLDLLCLAVEAPPEPGVPLSCFPLCSGHSPLSVTPAQVLRLRQDAFVDGQVTRRLSSATETRTEVQNSLQTLHPRYKRLQEPDCYTVR
ncbi:unnamed protein product, partial [Tetraodon nigroviridis]